MPPIESALRKLAVIQEKYLEVILPTVLVFTAVIVFFGSPQMKLDPSCDRMMSEDH